jgi:hypothetical protein
VSDDVYLYDHAYANRSLPGPPLSKDSAISVLLNCNVTVGIGIVEQWSARNTRFDVAWVRFVHVLGGGETNDSNH